MQEAIDIAEYILWYHYRQDILITNLRLQKLLYLVKGYTFKIYNARAFNEPVHQWGFGPALPLVHSHYKEKFAVGVPLSLPINYASAATPPSIKYADVVEKVCKASLKFTTRELVKMCSSHEYLTMFKRGDVIGDVDICSYFKRSDPLGIFTVL